MCGARLNALTSDHYFYLAREDAHEYAASKDVFLRIVANMGDIIWATFHHTYIGNAAI